MNKIKRYKLANIIKSIILMLFVGAILFLVITLFASLFTGFAYPIYLGIFSSLFYIVINLLLGPKIVLATVGARSLEEHSRYQEVKEIIEELCKKAQIPVPKLYYFEAEDINAFAVGLTKSNSAVAITTGALKHLDKDELAGVLGHEIAHIKNLDMFYVTLTSVLVGLISFICNWLIYSIFWSDRERSSWMYLLSFLVAIVMPIIVTIIRLAISREREYLADLYSAELNGKPDGLISAFRKIQMINRGQIIYSEVLEPLYFVSVEELLSTHPPIEKRIERLLKAFEK